MPKLDLRETQKQKRMTMADAPIGEWWIDVDGNPNQRVGDNLIWYDKSDKTFNFAIDKPHEIEVVRKLCDPIELIWE